MANSARIDELRKKFDENPRRYFAPLANEYRKSGDLDQAAFILEEYLPQQPGHMSGHIVYGQTLFELGRDEEAKRVFETALTLDPENLIALRHLGHIARQAGDFDSARSWYQRLLEADPRDAEIEQLLESLDSAAQARAVAPPIGVADNSLPPVADVPDESTSLEVEHVVEQEAPSVTRPTTYPLRPPTPAFAAPAAEVPTEPAAATEELLDIEDFSISGETAGASAGTNNDADARPVDEVPAGEPESHGQPNDDGLAIVGLDDMGFEHAHDEEASSATAAHSTEPLIESSEPELPDASVAGESTDFVPFSDLPAQTVEASAENVSGLETYTFESGSGSEIEAADDVGSFYLEPTETMPTASEARESESSEYSASEAEPPAPSVVDDQAEVPMAEAVTSPTPAYSTPALSSTPVSVTPVSTTPAVPAAAISATPTAMPGIDPGMNEDDTFATETMAKLYMSQGHFESALGIYRTLSAKNPSDDDLKRQVSELEDRVLRRRREPSPAAAVEAVAAPEPAVEEPIAAASGPTIRDFLVGIIRRGAVAMPASAPNGGSIDALFGGGVRAGSGAMDDDLVAADTLATAFAPEPNRDPMTGKPARPASTELSLDHVFREPAETPAAEDPAGFSFDQFFAGDLGDESGGEKTPAQGDADDIEQFNAWLNGLKKT